jgi:hypothetical protein
MLQRMNSYRKEEINNAKYLLDHPNGSFNGENWYTPRLSIDMHENRVSPECYKRFPECRCG